MKKTIYTVICAFAFQCISSQNAFMVRDIKIGGNSMPGYLTTFQGKVYFSANDSLGNQELFVSDGTDTGTIMLKDICPGTCSGDPQELFNGGNRLYFDVGAFPRRLYGCDGTANGTDTVNTTVTDGGTLFANLNGETFFVGGTFSSTGNELFKTNGTSAGTVLVKDVYTGVTGGMTGNLYPVGNKLFFVANDLAGYGLFVSDGSVGNATKVLSMNVNVAFFKYLGTHNSIFYFSQNDSVHGNELWASDGTIGGTVLLDLNTDVDGSSDPRGFAVMNNEVYVIANGGSAVGKELFKTNGTVGGTSLVKDAAPGADDGVKSDLMAVGTQLYFQGYTSGLNNTELWSSNGTTGGTAKLVEIFSTQGDIGKMGSINNKLVFEAGDNNGDIWGSDGTALGTTLLHATQFTQNVGDFIQSGNRLFFVGRNDSVGRELWTSDGTVNGTFLVINAAPAGNSDPQDLVDLNGVLFYTCGDGIHGRELWRVDTTQLALNLPNSIKQQNAKATIGLYPNPVSQTLYLQVENVLLNTETQMQIFDVSGKLIRAENVSSRNLDISALANGFYVLTLKTNSKLLQQKFVVQH